MEPIRIPFEKDWLSVSDIASYMDVSPYVVSGMLRRGELVGLKMGREWRVARIDFEDWLQARRADG